MKKNSGVTQKGFQWICNGCGREFRRVENALEHNFHCNNKKGEFMTNKKKKEKQVKTPETIIVDVDGELLSLPLFFSKHSFEVRKWIASNNVDLKPKKHETLHHNDSISEICRETKNNIRLLSHLKCAFHACIQCGSTMETKKLVFSAYQEECKRLAKFKIEEK